MMLIVIKVILSALIVPIAGYYLINVFRNNDFRNRTAEIFLFTMLFGASALMFSVWKMEQPNVHYAFLIGIVLAIIAAITFYIEKKYLEKVNQRRQAARKTEEVFDEISEQYGELFKISSRPMTKDESLSLSKSVRLGKIIGITASLVFLAASVLVYFEGIEGFAFVLGFCFLISVVGTVMAIGQGRRWTLENTVHTLQGVITNKEITELKTIFYEVSVSKRITIDLDKNEFNNLLLGDIVKIESISPSFEYQPKVQVIGKISD